MRVAVRLDDINPCMDYKKFCQIKDLLDKYNVCPLIGVVPDNQDRGIAPGYEINNYVDMLIALKNRGWVIAMHGVTHRYINDFSNRSEFCGLNYEEQYNKLKYGKEKLEKIIGRVEVFFAPSNNHDQNTVLALKELGFTHISYGENNKIFGNEILYIPIASGIRQVTRLVHSDLEPGNITTLVIHSNTVSNRLLKRYDKLLKKCYCRNKLVNYGDLLSETADIIDEKWVLKQRRINTFENNLSYIKNKLLRKT